VAAPFFLLIRNEETVELHDTVEEAISGVEEPEVERGLYAVFDSEGWVSEVHVDRWGCIELDYSVPPRCEPDKLLFYARRTIGWRLGEAVKKPNWGGYHTYAASIPPDSIAQMSLQQIIAIMRHLDGLWDTRPRWWQTWRDRHLRA
jgi:hypothetical protein